MKFTLSWLKDHLATKLDLEGIREVMLKAGLEVEHVDNPADRLAAFSVAHVKAAEPHPDADRLRVCRVDTVDGEKQIVCGAPNARAGMTAIYAPLGTYIPGLDFALDKKPRKIRGIESQGMLCSTKELEAGEDHDGIADLDTPFAVGTPAAEALGLDDAAIDFEVTPNRADWLGVSGIARDLAAAGAGRFLHKDIRPVPGSHDCPVDIVIEAPEACAVFAGATIRGVKNGPSPEWMRQRLKAIGIQPRSLLVDVTNYLSHDRARPLHVYDAGKLDGAVCARLGKPGERLEAIDGKTYEIGPEMCVIADNSGAIGLGGVMGGQSTAVSEETTEVFIESAWFDPDRTARTGRDTGIVSDARYRFERGVDPKSCLDGLNLAMQLITRYGGGEASHTLMVGTPPQPRDKVAFRLADVERLTGLKVRPAQMKRMVRDLGFAIEDAGDAWYLTVPSWRFDIEQSADLVEEIARLVGYDELPVASLETPAEGRRAMLTPLQERVRVARRVMAARGFLEAVTWSFMAREHAALFSNGDDGADPALAIANPVASDLDQMRPSILANLATAIQKAADRGERGVRLFEAGPVYLGDGPRDQRRMVSALVRPAPARHWQPGTPAYDAFAAKADLLALLDALGQPEERFQIAAPRDTHWHPGQSASLKLGPKVTVAQFGALHPRVLKALDVEGPLYGFELNLNALPQMKARRLKTRRALDVSDLSPVRRDLAFLVDEDVPAGEILRLCRAAEKTLISRIQVFDVYQGEGIDPGKKSIAIEITLQPSGDTLKDKDIDAIMDKLITAVAKGTGGVLRS
ncbi:MAG: phenylalanine--tRNA ligase subunit beta [Alphaproteobacteria bacterium]|jgi:phenylalanyl-tRNA synthetase beta chain|nr:phenylalanine--tRNA ligase subunit beta [Alphaproteobacteria bacterium]